MPYLAHNYIIVFIVAQCTFHLFSVRAVIAEWIEFLYTRALQGTVKETYKCNQFSFFKF